MGSNKLHRSMNQGEDFIEISGDLTNGGRKGDVAYGTLTSVHESDLEFGLIYTGSDDGQVNLTKNGGYTWETWFNQRTIVHNVTGSINIDFDNNTKRAWLISKKRTYTAISGINDLVMIWSQIGSFSEQGVNRDGDNFTTTIPTPIEFHWCQDGADYIVSALVIGRQAIQGGKSTVYGPDRTTRLLTVTLQPGEGLFHADAGSGLWHDVSGIEFDEGSDSSEGVRNTLGIDIVVEQ